MEFLDIGLQIIIIIYPTIVIVMVFMMTKVLECLWATEDVDIGLKRPSTLHLSIVEFIVLMIKMVTMVEVDIGVK